jgi:hypothetical protein
MDWKERDWRCHSLGLVREGREKGEQGSESAKSETMGVYKGIDIINYECLC